MIDDGDAVARVGLRNPSARTPDLYVVASLALDEEALAGVENGGPDVVFTDSAINGANGVEAARVLSARGAHPRVLIMSACFAPDRIRDAIEAGGAEYVPRDADPVESSRSVGGASAEAAALSHRVAKMALEPCSDRRVLTELTARERDVLALLVQGLSNRDIGRRLGITEKTVKCRLTPIFDRIGVTDRIQAALWAHARRASLETSCWAG